MSISPWTNKEFAKHSLDMIDIKFKPKTNRQVESEIKMLLRFCGFSEIQILSCNDGEFTDDRMSIDDIEMLVIAKKH